jgi:hypothetical protein
MADTPRLVSSMGRAELDRIFVRGYDLNQELLGKIRSHKWFIHDRCDLVGHGDSLADVQELRDLGPRAGRPGSRREKKFAGP